MRKVFDTNHPYFRPLWRRVAIVGFCGAWTFVEWRYGEQIWMIMILTLTVWLAWAFFLAFEPRDSE